MSRLTTISLSAVSPSGFRYDFARHARGDPAALRARVEQTAASPLTESLEDLEAAVGPAHVRRRVPSSVAAQARGVFGDGSERVLFATRIGPTRTRLLSVAPPRVGTTLDLVLELPGCVLTVPGRVVMASLDPGNLWRCGFDVAYGARDDRARVRLARLAMQDPSGLPWDYRELQPDGIEQRASPRISTRIEGLVRVRGLELPVVLENLSLAGALFVVRAGVEAPLQLGGRVEIELIASELPESLALSAHVVRIAEAGAIRKVAVAFEPLERDAVAPLEGLRLDALVLGTEPPD